MRDYQLAVGGGACKENCCFYDTECELSESHTQLLCRYLNADGTVTETKPFTVTGAITGTFSFFMDIFAGLWSLLSEK